jgi:DHA2 family multidrug resistance protein
VVDDPDYLKRERAGFRGKPLNFDSIGLSLLVLVMCCWEIMLSKGKEWDWLDDPFGRLQILLVLFVAGLVLLIVREMRCAHPIIDFRALGERNFAMSCIIMFSTMVVVYCGSIALPSLLQALMGYDALASGLVMSPSGVSCLAAMVVVGILLGRQVDARWLIAGGLVVMAAAYYWLARLNLQISPTHVIWPWMLMAAGGGLLFAPVNMAAFKYTPAHLRGAAVGLLSLLRTEGGSVGTSLAGNIQVRREQFHLSRLGEDLGPLNPHVQSFMDQGQGLFMQWTGDPVRSKQMSLQVLDNLRQQQALSLAFFDIFWLCAVLAVALVLLVLLMKRSVAGKGEHVAAH